MKTLIRILHLEDNLKDAELIQEALKTEGFTPEIKLVQTEAEYRAQLEKDWEIILVDYNLPQFDGMKAIRLAKERRPDLSIILLSGTIGEEVAVTAMRAGASDYVMKDQLIRLGPAVKRGLKESIEWRARHEADEALRQSEERLQQALYGADLGTWDWDVQTGAVVFNKRWVEMLGYNVDEIVPNVNTWKSLTHPEDLPDALEKLTAHLEGHTESYEAEMRMRHKSGKWIWILDKGRVIDRDEEGTALRICGTHLDITESKQSEEARNRFSWLLEKEQGIQTESVKPVYEDLTALNHDGLILKAVGADTLKSMSGDIMDLLDTCMAIYEKNGDYAFGTFVSRWCGTLDNASRALCDTDDDQKALHSGKWLCHESCWRISKNARDSGKPVDEACCGGLRIYAVPIHSGKQIIGVINFGYNSPPQTGAKQKALAESFQLDLKIIQQNAESYKPRPPFIINVAKRRLQSIAHLIGEIVERKQSEELLRESESRFRYLFENAPLGYQSLDDNGDIIELNETWCKILGYAKTEALGREFGEFVHPDSPIKFAENFPKFKSRGIVTNAEFEMIKKDGSTVMVSIDGKIEHNSDGSFKQTHCMLRDISDQKILEEQFRQAQKMESVGRLAGGVAHDFNNLLMGIMGYVDLCRDEVGSNPTVLEYLDAITQGAERSAAITRQLLAFARKQIMQPKELDLNEAIEGMLKLLRRLLGEDIEINWSPGTGAMTVKMDPSQIDQILANLAVNARDAIGGVGHLTIETGYATIDAEYCNTHAEALPGSYVVLTVSDTGKGMDEETLEHLFEPFFTTKGVGQGTGLGLATVYGIVKQNNGFVYVYSEQEKGTTFKIYIPRYGIKSKAPTDAAPAPALPGGSETILIAEDEKAIRMTCKFFLEALGYSVLAAENPAKALDLVAEHSGKIHLLLSDVVMPGLSGPDLAEQLLEKYPKMKCLFMSGFTPDIIAQRGVLEKDMGFISKPFNRNQLAQKVSAPK